MLSPYRITVTKKFVLTDTTANTKLVPPGLVPTMIRSLEWRLPTNYFVVKVLSIDRLYTTRQSSSADGTARRKSLSITANGVEDVIRSKPEVFGLKVGEKLKTVIKQAEQVEYPETTGTAFTESRHIRNQLRLSPIFLPLLRYRHQYQYQL